ncbi:hypothetical protein RB195_011169 [Necator americanus]|uniref:Reverse transcriptase domain-containing protein n=1 Tax=Necator americanus TaxID=51031 RepID=A0ABR1D2F8_NECAM
MWDLLVLTAGNESQKRDFEILLAESDVLRYCREVAVIADYPHEVKIGSGGATMNVLHTLGDGVVEKHILLIHSGGLSQRMPHLSALGKIFATLPDGSSILEKKLNTYKLLPTLLPPGLLICASDVVEDVSAFKECNPESQMIAFATESSLEIAVDHGVFVLDSNGNLKSVLQKPSLKLLKDAAAVLPSGNALTDCFYWISWTVCEQLGSLWRDSGPCTVETCCYGDFMRPLGYAPLLDYIEQGPAELSMWRKSFAEIFSKISPQVVNLGVDSFFHMGTPRELKQHCRRNSVFHRKFLSSFSEAVHCSLTNCSALKLLQSYLTPQRGAAVALAFGQLWWRDFASAGYRVILLMSTMCFSEARASPRSDAHCPRPGNVANMRGLPARRRSRPKKLVRHRQQHPVRLAALNVGTLTQRSRELANTLRKRRVDICCVQETRWKSSKSKELGDGYKLIYHGTSNRNGIGIILNETFRNSATVDRLSERLMAVKVDTAEGELQVVSAYAPQVGCSEEEKACFWENLQQYVQSLEGEEVLLIGGDFNGHVGSRKDGFKSCHGGYGYGGRNDHGLRILEYAAASDVIIANTQYRKRKSHLITYTSGFKSHPYRPCRCPIPFANHGLENLLSKEKTFKDRDTAHQMVESEGSKGGNVVAYFQRDALDRGEHSGKDDSNHPPIRTVPSVDGPALPITAVEVSAALAKMKSNKATGPDDIPADAYTTAVPYDEGFERFLEARLRKVVSVSLNQCGFVKDCSTIDAIHAIRIFLEKHRKKNRSVHLAFLDLEKAFDRVPHELLWMSMKSHRVPEEYVRWTKLLYAKPTSVVRCAAGTSRPFPVQVGVHQGSSLSPLLVILCMDTITEEIQKQNPWTLLFASLPTNG